MSAAFEIQSHSIGLHFARKQRKQNDTLEVQALALQIFRQQLGVIATPEKYPFTWHEALVEARAPIEEVEA